MVNWDRVGAHTLAATDVYQLDSEHVGDRLEVTVASPVGGRSDDGPLATLYVLDPMATFDIVTSITRTFHLLGMGGFPPLLVVGVGYDLDPLSAMSVRFRDLTPTEAEPPGTMGPPIPVTHGTGGADRFLGALVDEVAPLVEQHHGADPADRTIVGWSLGALFGTHALLTRPAAFHRYVLVSPSLWWDDEHVLRFEEDTAAERSACDARVYLAVGDREESSLSRTWPSNLSADAVAAGRMVSNVVTLARRLRRRGTRGLDIEVEVLPDEHHSTIFPTAVSRALVHLFGPDTAT